jgi:hypothetical protein
VRAIGQRVRRQAITPLTDVREVIAGAAPLERQYDEAEPTWPALNQLPGYSRLPFYSGFQVD